MKVRIFGFGLHLGSGISYDDFFTFLEASNGREIDDRILSVVKQGDYWTGLLITIKDQKAYCALKRSGKDFTVTAQELEEGTSMVDFNFFAVYGATGRGLYQHYHQSSHASTFCDFLKYRYLTLKKQKVQEEVGNIETADRKAVADASKKYKGSLRFSIMCRKETLEDRIKALDRVKNFEFEFATLEFDHDPLAPLTKVAKRRSERFVFSRDNADLVKKNVVKFLEKAKLRRVRVEGVDPSGLEQIYKLQNDYDTLAEYEFDDVIRTVSVDSNDLVGSIKKSKLVDILLAIADKKAKAMLTAPVATDGHATDTEEEDEEE